MSNSSINTAVGNQRVELTLPEGDVTHSGRSTGRTDVRECLCDWCQQNHLQMTVRGQKELGRFLHVPTRPSAPVSIQGNVMERVSSYKYRSVNLNNKLGRSAHTGALYKKGQSRRLLPGRLRSHYQRCPPRTSEDLLWLYAGISHLLWSGLLCGQHLRKEETGECWLSHHLAAPSVTACSTLAVGERFLCSL